MGADEDNDDPQKEDSLDFENEPTGQEDAFRARQDEVEGTKNFERAYDKLI